VSGFSNSGIGVNGFSTSGHGVEGFSTHSYGIEGSTSGSFASIAGVQGVNNATTTAVRASGHGGPLFVGNNSVGIDVFKVDNGGNMTLGGNATVSRTASVAGISGSGISLTVDLSAKQDLGISGSGFDVGVEGGTGSMTGSGGTAGVQGNNNTTSTAVRANGFGGLLFDGNNSFSHDVFTVDDGGNVNAHSYSMTLAAASGRNIATYAPQVSEPILEDFGEGQLINGWAYVRLDNRFGDLMARPLSYLVFITPEGDNRGLYVTQKTPQGFVVRESQGGHATLAFSYRIVAKPFGVSATRLPMVTFPARHAKIHSMRSELPPTIALR
jgi:hypothetical protein